MRNLALLPLLCVAGLASAAPATDAAVAEVMRKLHKDSIGVDLAAELVAGEPALNALPEERRQCARGAIHSVLQSKMRQAVISQLGNDGDAVIDEWSRFLDTPSGKGYQAMTGGLAEAEAASIGVQSEQYQTGLETFMASAAHKRLLASFGDAAPSSDLFQQLADGLQDQCRIALKPEEIS